MPATGSQDAHAPPGVDSLKIDESKMSARMKRFTDPAQGGERIVGGKVEQVDATEAKNDEDLEVVM